MQTTIKAILLSSLIFAPAVFANTTAITFAKGSYCGSFEGNIVNRKFTVQAKANQSLEVKVKSDNIAQVNVKDSSGRNLKYINSKEWDGWQFLTKKSGKHTITLTPEIDDDEEVWVNFEVCAY